MSETSSTSATTGAFDNLYYDPDTSAIRVPYCDATQYLINGEIKTWTGKIAKVTSPIYNKNTNERVEIGQYGLIDAATSQEAVQAAYNAFNNGRGEWPTASVRTRITAVEKFLDGLKAKRDEIVNLLQWEICKNTGDAQKEIDRTIKYTYDTIAALKNLENKNSQFLSDSGVVAQVRRVSLGVVLCLGPFNYPFNETYTTLIPAIIMGNTVVMKLPRTGCLCHSPTLQLFKDCFPPGVVNIITGAGRETMPPIMATGLVDIFAFIGTSKAAATLQKSHPHPHRLRVCFGLDAKNPAIVLPDADLKVAVNECVLGSLSFNGQRCTALKILFVHKDIVDRFIESFVTAVDALKMALPWEDKASITPLAEPEKPEFLKTLIEDAKAHGARVVNARGAQIDRSFVAPTVLFPVSSAMRIYHEEQFGPVVPIIPFEKIDEVMDYVAKSSYGQQASVFSSGAANISTLVDTLVHQVARVNINSQCQRGPDTFPFTGRKDSAFGTLSVDDALRVFSIRSLVATKADSSNQAILTDILHNHSSAFLRSDFLL